MRRLTREVKAYLEREPKFRERRNKDRGIVNILMAEYPTIYNAVKSGMIPKDFLVTVLQNYATMDRAWRKLLRDNVSLREKTIPKKPS